jgi:hypothetical protein
MIIPPLTDIIIIRIMVTTMVIRDITPATPCIDLEEIVTTTTELTKGKGKDKTTADHTLLHIGESKKNKD